MGGVVGIPIHVPDVRHALLLEETMNALANPDQAVSIARGEPQQFYSLLRSIQIRHKVSRRFSIWGRGKPANPRKLIDESREQGELSPKPIGRGRVLGRIMLTKCSQKFENKG